MRMESVRYDDLLSVPFLKGGRTREGMDCYGVCIEMCRRCGKTLPDIDTYGRIYSADIHGKDDFFSGYVRQADGPGARRIVEYMNSSGETHVGFMLSDRLYIHATEGGVRVTPLIAVKNPKFYEVIR